MQNKIKKLFIGAILCLSLSAVFGSSSSQAASKPQKISMDDNGNTVFSADITGDNKKDRIEFKSTKDSYNMFLSKIQVYINGKKALTINDKNGNSYNISANYIKMSKSKTFLQIIGHGDNDFNPFNTIYRYDKSKKKLVSALTLVKKGSLNTAKDVTKYTGKSITIAHTYQPGETGWIDWNYTYTYKSGKFKLKSASAPVKSIFTTDYMHDGYGKYFKKNQFVATGSRNFYTSTSMKNVSFKAKNNDVLTLKKIKISGNKMYLQFQKGKKAGWQRVNRSYSSIYGPSITSNGWFYGVRNRLAG